MTSRSLTIGSRYCGPPRSGNGGYVAGSLAAFIPAAPATVTLRQPPPLDTPLQVLAGADTAELTFGGAIVADAAMADATVELEAVDPVSADEVAAAETAYGGLTRHPFPTCFVCGTDRSDGLGLRPGIVSGRPGVTATWWRPGKEFAGSDGGVLPAYVWAALDCPGGWTNDLLGRPMVLGRMTACVDVAPQVGEPCLIMGRLQGTSGRKSFTATTAYDGDGRILARAVATWFVVNPDAFS